MAEARVIYIYDEGVPLLPVKGNTPCGYYDNDPNFQLDAGRFVKFAARQLGYPMIDIELQDVHFYSCFENAISTYGKELYEYKIRENYLSLEGSTITADNLNTTLIQPNLGNIIRIAQDYGTEAGTGGNVTYYTGSIPLQYGVQNYDVNQWALSSSVIQPGDKIEI